MFSVFKNHMPRALPKMLAAGSLFCFTGVSSAAIVNADVTAPGDLIYPVQITASNPNSTVVGSSAGGTGGQNASPANEAVPNSIDNNQNNKYLQFAGTSANTTAGNFGGLLVTPAAGTTILNGIRFSTGNDGPERDPLTVSIYGTNSTISSGLAAGATPNATFSLIYTGTSGLTTDPGRNTFGPTVNFVPTTAGAFTSYEVLVTSTRGDPSQGCCFQFGEVELIGNTVTVPEPATFGALGAGALALLVRRRRRA